MQECISLPTGELSDHGWLYTSSVQVSGGNNFTAECPMLDMPPSGVYTQPVRLGQDLRLTTKNLIAPVSHMTSVPDCSMASYHQTDGFDYSCVVNGVSLTAQYENESSILCTVGKEQVSVAYIYMMFTLLMRHALQYTYLYENESSILCTVGKEQVSVAYIYMMFTLLMRHALQYTYLYENESSILCTVGKEQVSVAYIYMMFTLLMRHALQYTYLYTYLIYLYTLTNSVYSSHCLLGPVVPPLMSW